MATQTRLASMMGPWRLVWLSIKFHVTTILSALRATGPTALLRPKQLHAKAVADMFITASPNFIAFESANTPLQTLLSTATGTTLDLGPGPGNQLHRFPTSAITHIYGIEPSPHYAAHLASRVTEIDGLAGKYTVLTCGIEDADVLEKAGLGRGSVDTIACIQVLCSVGDVKEVMERCYALLRPGGRFVFWEHVGSYNSTTSSIQALWNPIWSSLVGCHLNRDILGAILAAGEWENVEDVVIEQDGMTCLPRVWGVLRKKA
ncbi:methyltransferase type 11 [Paraphoma chrysanthemicola]|uniref:Methyltransferase type 11 n=1 Tax=Paraphoma chrysanthemicola TaxID=798071 RepID=A0A8K0RAM8_9PLEO|nr:methyltransferase type 11 [Paraphoma chrysanthemicola]